MTLDEYQRTAWETMRPFTENQKPALFYLGLGLVEETGEVCQRLKRMISGGREEPSGPDRGALMLELGDVLWYVACIAFQADITLENVAVANQNKLGKRNPR